MIAEVSFLRDYPLGTVFKKYAYICARLALSSTNMITTYLFYYIQIISALTIKFQNQHFF